MNTNLIVKLLVVTGGSLASIGALPSLISASSDSKVKSPTKTSTTHNYLIGKDIKFEEGNASISNYCFYFQPDGIIGVPRGKSQKGEYCRTTLKYHESEIDDTWPRIQYKWQPEDKGDKKVLLVSGLKKKKANIIGCFDAGWWGHRPTSNFNGSGAVKVGDGYLTQDGKFRQGRNTLKAGVCSNGAYEIENHKKNIEQKYDNEKNKDWNIKLFEKLNWIILQKTK